MGLFQYHLDSKSRATQVPTLRVELTLLQLNPMRTSLCVSLASSKWATASKRSLQLPHEPVGYCFTKRSLAGSGPITA
jgi:hypothetical protein